MFKAVADEFAWRSSCEVRVKAVPTPRASGCLKSAALGVAAKEEATMSRQLFGFHHASSDPGSPAIGAGYTYKGSCKKAVTAGCAGYVVSFPGRRAVYMGR